jgi:hypothetical protein
MKRPVRSRPGKRFGAGCCGGWRLETSGYPIMFYLTTPDSIANVSFLKMAIAVVINLNPKLR